MDGSVSEAVASEVRPTLGAELERLRLAMGLTREELSRRVGMREAYLDGIETGREEPTAHALERLAKELEPAGASTDSLTPLLAQPEFNFYGDYVSGTEGFSFTGRGGDYFRIWIVNLLLSVLTLGIYSAWAKVRQRQYFYRHTRVAGASFDYHGNPIAILKGRVLTLVFLIAYYIGGTMHPAARPGAFIVLLAALPWLLVRSLRFRFHNSSYRGIRFAFFGSTRSAYWVFCALPIAVVASLFTLVPFWHQRIRQYQNGHATFGRVKFTFDAPVSGFYKTYAVAALLAIGFLSTVVLALAGAGLVLGTRYPIGSQGSGRAMAVRTVGFAIVLIGYWSAAIGLRTFVNAWTQNLVWRHTQLGPHRFESSATARRLFSITATNLVATICTVGLFQPFAQVRLMQYLASTLSLIPGGTLDEIAASDEVDVPAFGEEAIGWLDLDIAF